MTGSPGNLIRLMKHPLRSRIFLLLKLPSAFLAGVRIRDIDEQQCRVTVPYTWLSQNPFRSTYFACLAMAAEMSTGALAMAHVYKRNPPVSMLVLKLEADYYKKATGITVFTCGEGEQLKAAVEQAITTGEGSSFTATSVGKNKAGETVAVFRVTWSFKSRKRAGSE
jgi:acyl-coenzyme A thioesterase PaaI-like protein